MSGLAREIEASVHGHSNPFATDSVALCLKIPTHAQLLRGNHRDAAMSQDRKTLFDVDVRRHVREAQTLRARCMAVMLRSLACSARSRLHALTKLVGRPHQQPPPETASMQAEGNRP